MAEECEAKASIIRWRPLVSGEVEVGTSIKPELKIVNLSNYVGRFYWRIKKDDETCVQAGNITIQPKALSFLIECDSFNMPNRNVKIEFDAGHYCGNELIEDDYKLIILIPKEEATAKGEFVGDPTYPASKIVGERYNVTATGKNIGGVGAYFRLRLYEGTTEISHGGLVYRGSGKSFTQTLSGTMPNRDLNLILNLMRKV